MQAVDRRALPSSLLHAAPCRRSMPAVTAHARRRPTWQHSSPGARLSRGGRQLQLQLPRARGPCGSSWAGLLWTMRVLPCSSPCFSARCTALSDGCCSAVWAESSMDLSSIQVCAWDCEPCIACALGSSAISLHGRGTRIDGKMVMAMLSIMPELTGQPAHGRLDTLAHPWASVCR